MSREELIETNERLRAVRVRLEESYDTAKKALVTLMNKYGDSKSQRNVFNRYPMLKLMIKDVIRLETQYWTLVEIPKQEKLETVPAFVLRACSIMEKSQKSGEGVKTSAKLAEEAAEKRERMERLEIMTTAQVEQENTQMINDLYRLLKKYTGLRNLIRELKSEYGNSKIYPIFPRYTMLKDMIKDIMHDPDYMEVCHELVFLNELFKLRPSTQIPAMMYPESKRITHEAHFHRAEEENAKGKMVTISTKNTLALIAAVMPAAAGCTRAVTDFAFSISIRSDFATRSSDWSACGQFHSVLQHSITVG
ncbi:conserved hypothetical protein [Culex quinquefasciatus]|uniref:Uncharacterized protein n=1 Tax=Culex quinquefasciatus TaxID=7176 RepID=B0X2Q2_CULQU|nr:conserved hypothetical protein [Culex quinquefasciatus]|eukprot:XP_001863924.1 conserved hypothetical protein [Culex quinquefasciatus]